MDQYKNILFIIVLAVFTCSCSKNREYQDAVSIQFEDFESTQSLSGTIVEFDDIILKPNRLAICDTVLITIDSRGKLLFNIYNMNSKKKMGERVSMGQGPNEMIRPSFVNIGGNNISFFDMATSTIVEYSTPDFINEINPEPVRKIKLSERVFGEASSTNQGFLCSSYNPSHLFLEFSETGERLGEFGDYPVCAIEYTDYEKMEAFRFSFTTNQVNKVFVCYNWTDLLEIYNANGTLEKRIHGPKHFYAHFKEFHDGNYTSARHEEGKNRDAYFSPVNVGDEIFVLFSGKYLDEEGYNILANTILVFDWDGNPKQMLSLDKGVFAITVDKANKIIYGISDQPEYHIVGFSYN
jgi:hypothetical protein